MKKTFVAVMVLASCAIAVAAKAQQKPEDLARQSAKPWLALVDSGKYAQSWNESSQYMRSSITKDKWDQEVGKARVATGVLRSRDLASIQYKKGLPNMPTAEYVMAVYNSSFQHWASAVETVFVMRDKDGKWRVAGYFVKPK